MQFEFTGPQTELEKLFGGHFCINAYGKIKSGDDEKFREFLGQTNPPPRTSVYIDSSGGNVEAAMGIGRLIRSHWFSTAIGSYRLDHGNSPVPLVPRKRISGQCMSAATLVFLAGRLRYYRNDSKFGVHQFSFKNPSPSHIAQSQILSAQIASYVIDMGISPEFLEISSLTASEQVHLLGESELQRLNIVTGSQTLSNWSVQARGHILYVRGERDSMYGHHKVMLCYSKSVGFSFWAVIEAQGRESELSDFGLVEVVINGEEKRIDISERSLRHLNGIYINVFSRITEDEARLIAYSDSFGVQIRLSQEAEMFLGVSAVSTEGGREILESFYSVLSENG